MLLRNAILQQKASPSEIAMAVKLYDAEVRPPWNPSKPIISAGNSISINIGSSISTNEAIQSFIEVGSPNNVDANLQVGAGTNMAEARAFLEANLTAPDKAKNLVLTDPVAGETLTVGVQRKNFWNTDDVFADLEAIQALQTGGARTLTLMVAAPATRWAATLGTASAEYTKFKERIIAKTYSHSVADIRQYIIDRYTLNTGFEKIQREWNELPVGYCGNADLVTLARSTADIKIENPLTLNSNDGDPLTPNVNSANYGLWQHVGAFGAGKNIISDQIHPNSRGRIAMGENVRDWDLAILGFAPYLPPGIRVRTSVSAANNEIVAVFRVLGVPDSIDIPLSSAASGAYTATFAPDGATGDAIVTVRRNTAIAITPGEVRLYVRCTKGIYNRVETVRLMVAEATGNRVPTSVRWNTYISFRGPRSAINQTSTRRFSLLVAGQIDNLAANVMLFQALAGATQDQIIVRAQSTGRINVNVRNGLGTLSVNCTSRSFAQGGPVLASGIPFILGAAFDWENGVGNMMINGVNLPISGAGASFTSINVPLNLTDTLPIYFGSQLPNGYFRGSETIPDGVIRCAAIWDNTYHNFAAVWGEIADGSNNFILSDPQLTLNGVPSHPARVRGGRGTILAGGQDANVMVLPTWRPGNLVDI